MDVVRWFNQTPDLYLARVAWWPWVTVALSALAVAGYAVIAFHWYFLSKLSDAASRAAAGRLCLVVGCCALCGAAFYATEPAWLAWRAYDLVLLLLVCYTWWFGVRLRGVARVDDRLAMVAELERSAAKYREMAELLPEGVWTANADGWVDFSNERWAQYAGPGVPWTDAVHPEEQSEVELWWRRAVRDRAPVSREVRLRGLGDADGDGGPYRAFVVRATPVFHGDGVKWLGACADIEEQRRVATEREVQARQKAFFLNALSHDLRAPLHNVVLNAHLLKLSGIDAGQLDSVNMIIENAAAAGDLVTRLLEFAKAGEDRDEPERTSVSSLLRQVVRRFQPAAEHKGLYLRLADGLGGTADDGADAYVWADRRKLDRLVTNLVDNALKFTTRGGVALEWAALGDQVAVRIRDSGIGIPEGSAPYLFDEFYQVDNHERDRTKGFGIGLAICRSLARQLGGDVRLVASSSEGSCFEVVVPAAVRAGRGGRPDGEAGDRVHPEAAGLCRL